MEKIDHNIHVLSLVIKKENDIPLVRTKAKILSDILGFSKIKSSQIGLISSEISRRILRRSQGGLATFFIICRRIPGLTQFESGIMLEFSSEKAPFLFIKNEASDKAFIYSSKKVTDKLEFEEGKKGEINRIRIIFFGATQSCEDLEKKNDIIKKRLFKDIEESYLENLRAKHEEVLRLLKTLTIKNKELDKVNAELLELSKDMESLVHERTVVEFALKIADKIRNPATVIGGLSRLLLKKMPKDSPFLTKVQAIFQEAKKLEQIVKDFEGLVKEQEVFFVELDLNDLVKEVLEAWMPGFEKKNIRLRVKYYDGPLKIHGNPKTLKVALLHVLKNALDASIEGSPIEINIARINGRPTVEIKDYGIGIDEKIKRRLFKELVTTKPSGTGVGLIMVHHIMLEHQGKIDIESQKGLGTTVRLIFPMRWKE